MYQTWNYCTYSPMQMVIKSKYNSITI